MVAYWQKLTTKEHNIDNGLKRAYRLESYWLYICILITIDTKIHLHLLLLILEYYVELQFYINTLKFILKNN